MKPLATPLNSLPFTLTDCILIPIRAHHYERIVKRDIRYFQAEGNWVDLFTTTHMYRLSTNIGQIQAQLDKQQFVRISRRHLVNIDRTCGLRGSELLIDDEPLPIGRQYRTALLSVLPILRMKAEPETEAI
ncbi:LytR/AlgR family response regulator transcription factor [Fibrella aquatilis]|uniref:LytTR family transcriptional regulator n=1 Tax=Fibrella aquatilis TaxID=2817059 RepID=A0A939GBI8_9BACT|nr:LytTR family DNA-binding domain-containing protein [Fibrella aquatilis]MBO0933825.1 LytTR family transcriptional regulator [Fibrella aquatilis]